MADAKVPLPTLPAQFPISEPTPGPFLHLAIIQLPIRKWQKPWQHQRVIALFAASSEALKLRLQLERRLRVSEQLLRVVEAGAR